MYRLSEVYGNDYKDKSKQSAIDMVLNNLSNNIANRSYDFRFDTSIIWTSNNTISNDYIMDLFNKIKNLNKYLNIVHILDKNLLYSIVQEKSVEYFLIVDTFFKKSFVIYITKNNMGIL